MTAVEWLAEQFETYFQNKVYIEKPYLIKMLEQAKEMEKTNTDNKVIHFAEWLTKKHSYTLMALYEHFEEEYYKKEEE
jgi:wyosine [tRNA(Phe)-imidazoG37] synthetase (radical SAM superfamily)